ncbi:uncharacterized protein LOC119336324 isoform X2 [Triticum dicoccoides]|uniref:uncharacterized protein LOC119336324 isoform X2 n=1 Tax=Triticum dicoccoides TaxID=85692 RepID=UPI001890DBB8|nr:uncharacterized protein LOC119336324 isoform X2 [Triticum dicoccoides]
MGGTPRVCAARLLAAKCESQKCHLQRSRNRASNHGASLNSKVKATFLRFCAHAQARRFNTHFQMLMPEETRGKYWKNSCNQDEQGFCKREGV